MSLRNPVRVFHKREKAFTLIEILIAMSILTAVILAVTTMLRNSLDIKLALSDENAATQRINRILYRVSSDLSQAFVFSRTDVLRGGETDRTHFKLEKGSNFDTIGFTYVGHKQSRPNAHESSMSYVLYKLENSKKNEGRRHLYRGETPRVPESFAEDPKMELFAENVHSIRFYPWNGEDWSKDKWDSSSFQSSGKLPHMILVEVKVWVKPVSEGEDSLERDEEEELERYATIVYLENSLDRDELKARSGSFKL